MEISSSLIGKSGVYYIKNKIKERFYIGSSSDIYTRLHGHKSALNRGNHYRILQNAWNKYLEDNFECGILIECENDTAILRQNEQRFVDILNSYYNTNKIVTESHKRIFTQDDKDKIRDIVKSQFDAGNHFSEHVNNLRKTVYVFNIGTNETISFKSQQYCVDFYKKEGLTMKILCNRILQKTHFNKLYFNHENDFKDIKPLDYKKTGREVEMSIYDINKKLIKRYNNKKELFKEQFNKNYCKVTYAKYIDSNVPFKGYYIYSGCSR